MSNLLNYISKKTDDTKLFVENLQSKKKLPSLLFGVIKKYSEDNGGNLSAVIAYFSLLSIFPLILIFTSLSQLILKNNPVARDKLSYSIDRYLPVVGAEIQASVHSPNKAGLTLIVGLIIILYGARAGANAFQYAHAIIWDVPIAKRPNYLDKLLRSLGIIVFGGIGLVLAAIVFEYTVVLGKGWLFYTFSTILSLVVLWLTFIVVAILSVPGKKSIDKVLLGATTAAIGVQILQAIGGIILSRELKRLNSSYGVFALLIGLAFWIYLETQIVLYCSELNVVWLHKLFPRSLDGNKNAVDKKVLNRRIEALKQD